jgi:hypothetical protein
MKAKRLTSLRVLSRVLLLSAAAMGAGMAANAQVAITTKPTPIAASAPTAVPTLIPYSGLAIGRQGEPLPGDTAITFLIFKEEQGGEPVWMETQTVAVDGSGHYQVQLGAGSPGGMPTTTFASGEGRWLEVQIAGQQAKPRVLLASVPYAMKSAEAETLGGLTAQSFVTQAQLASAAQSLAAKASPLITPTVTPTGSGSTNSIPLWTSPTVLGNSVMTQSGANINIGSTTTPASLGVYGNISNSASGTYTNITSTAYNNEAYEGPRIAFNRYEGTLAAPAVVKLNDTVGWFDFFAYDGSVAQRAAEFTVFVDGTPNSGIVPGRFEIETASSTGADTARITAYSNDNVVMSTHGGSVGIGTGTPAATLEVNGTAKFDGNITFASTQTFPVKGTGGGTITGITTSSPLTGSGTTGSVALGLNENTLASDITPTLESSFNSIYPQLSQTNTFSTDQFFNGNVTVGETLQSGAEPGGSFSYPDGNGIVAFSTTGDAIFGYAGPNIGGAFENNNNYSSPVGNYKSSNPEFYTPAIQAENEGSGGALAAYTSGYGTAGFFNSEGPSSLATNQLINYTAALWADSPAVNGLIGSSDKYNGGSFFNNSSSYATVLAKNYDSSGSTGLVVPAEKGFGTVIRAEGPGGACGVNTSGDVSCTGQLKALASTQSGARQVETYSVQSSENWLEDAGSGELVNGKAVVQLDPTFADAANPGVDFHVFLTPNGDCKGLFVTNKTATGFEVHELGGGTASVGFDYRIMAKRRGYESERLTDVTERFQAEKAAASGPSPKPTPEQERVYHQAHKQSLPTYPVHMSVAKPKPVALAKP